MNSSIRSAGEYGASVAAVFDPHVDVRSARPVTMTHPLNTTIGTVLGGQHCDPDQFVFQSKDEFVSGGFNRGTAFKGIDIVRGEVQMTGQSSLGPSFETYLSKYDADELHEIVSDYRHGIDVTREKDMKPEYLAMVQPTDAVLMAEVVRRMPKVRNSVTVSQHAEFVASKITEMVANGAITHLGTVAEVSEKGLMPLEFGSLTVEPEKPRLCYNCRALNGGTNVRSVALEGLADIRREIEATPEGVTYGCVADEQSGYLHQLLSVESRKFFGVMVFGHVFVYNHPPFGWANSCQLHQQKGLIYTGYFRFMGGRCSQYIDDHNIITTGTVEDSQRDVSLFLLVKGVHGGYSFGYPKCSLVPSQRWSILGLEVDSENKCFRVPVLKRHRYAVAFESLERQLKENRVNLFALAAFAGQTVYYGNAIPVLSSLQNIAYCILAQNGKLDYVDPVFRQRLWWELPRNVAENLDVSSTTAQMLLQELRLCNVIVQLDRAWSFLEERHESIVSHFSDATPFQGGTHIQLNEGMSPPPGWGKDELVFGGVLPELLELPGNNGTGMLSDMVAMLLPLRLELKHGNIGIAEGAALIIGLMTIDSDVDLCKLYTDVQVDFYIDNMEMYWLFRRRRVKKSENRLQKLHYFNVCYIMS